MVYYGGLEYFISRELDTISSSGNKAIPGKITTFVLQLPHFRLTYIASVFHSILILLQLPDGILCGELHEKLNKFSSFS
mgnify:CR=1 FL=1